MTEERKAIAINDRWQEHKRGRWLKHCRRRKAERRSEPRAAH